jgi:hypothetical protein
MAAHAQGLRRVQQLGGKEQSIDRMLKESFLSMDYICLTMP